MADNKKAPKRLVKSANKMIFGVCGGIADYLNLDPTIVRLGWVLLTAVTGFFLGIVAYIVAALVIPEK